MPELAEMDFPLGDVADWMNTAGPRAEGYHLTSLIKASKLIAKGLPVDPEDFYYRQPESGGRGEGDWDEMTLGMMNMGRVWEEASRGPFQARVKKLGMWTDAPTQDERDGVVVNVDGLIYHPGPPVALVAIEEAKFRFARPHDPRDNLDWMGQVKGYCKVFGVNAVWMPICFIQTRPPLVESHIYMVNFTQREVDENWHMITRTRDYLERMRGGNKT